MDAFERNSERIEAIRAQARLAQARPAFGDVADVEPDVAQNFPAGPQQRNIGGSLAWELYNRDTGETVRTFWQPNEAEASRTAQEYVRDLSVPGSYSIRPQMATNESRDLRESAMMGKIESTGKIVRIIRKQHSVKFSDQKDWLLIDTDPAKGNQGAGLKWVPASTRFEWVRPYRDTVDENFADGKGPGRPGDSVRHGIPKKATMAELEKASHAKGRKGQLARWQINMRRGKAKK
jgi:hypothetical protein